MKKTLFVTNFFAPSIGGIESYLYNLADSLPKDKIVVLANKIDKTEEFDSKQNFKIYRKKFFSFLLRPSWLPLIFYLYYLIKKEKIEIICFGHYFSLCSLGYLFKKLLKIPYYIFVQGIDIFIPQKNNFQKRLMIFNLRKSEKIIASSYFLKEELLKLKIEEKKIEVIHPGLRLEKFDYNLKKNLKEELGLKDKKIILSLGRIIERKGFDLVIEALPKVLKKFNNLVYLIVGEGEYRKKLEELVKKLNLEDKVLFVGGVENIEEKKIPYYALSDIFILPTKKISRDYTDIESFGIVYLEALAMKRPVIASKLGGAREIIIDHRNGFLVDPENIEEISQAILKLLENEELRRKFGAKGRKIVEEKFNLKEQAKRVEKILV